MKNTFIFNRQKKVNSSEVPTVHMKFRNFPPSDEHINHQETSWDLDTSSNSNLYNRNSSEKHGQVAAEGLWIKSIDTSNANILRIESMILTTYRETNTQEYFKKIYKRINEYWHENYPVNILFTGGDVVVPKEFTLPHFKFFTMFNYASVNKSHTSRAGKRNIRGGNEYFENYFNCDVRYYPFTMSEQIWEVGNDWFSNWQDYWEYEQDLYNAMQREQQAPIDDLLHPKFAFQLPANEFKDSVKIQNWNNLSLKDALIIHLHSTRNSEEALRIARELCG